MSSGDMVRSAEPAGEQDSDKQTVVHRNSAEIVQYHRIIRFRNRPMVLVAAPYPHFTPLHKENFDRLAYPLLGGVSRSRMSDVYAYVTYTSVDHSDNEHLILFGVPIEDVVIEADTDLAFMTAHKPAVWDMQSLCWSASTSPDQCVWRSPTPRISTTAAKRTPIPFILSLAGGDSGLYDDIMQSIAPILMEKKPDGVIWWVGDGANGKSTLMDALYKVFPGQLSSLTVKRLTDGRDTPSLNGTLANIVKESSEGRIDDTEIYKSIGTHENFRVHKFHSQDDIEVRGNLHHIFSANTIPTFNDKGYSARRRTFVIPFSERFKSDPTFEEQTFTQEFFGQLVQELSFYAVQIRQQGYRYKWSGKTLAAKAQYDAEASNAEEYACSIIDEGVVGFNSFNPVRVDYENWCADMGYVPLGVGNLRRSLLGLGFERVTVREGKETAKVYRLPGFDKEGLRPFGMGRPGLFTVQGFQPQPDSVPTPEFKEPTATEPDQPRQSILNGKW